MEVRELQRVTSDRVKCVVRHPSEPWAALGLYTGQISVISAESHQTLKTLDVASGCPVRSVALVVRRCWLISASDDGNLRVFNYNTLDKVKTVQAHADYIRRVAVHATQPLVLSASDDRSIKLWNWEAAWQCTRVFVGHTHYVMDVAFDPRNSNNFASASLDGNIKLWSISSGYASFTLEGHRKGVNSVAFAGSGESPYLATGSDDRTVRIIDYHTKRCIRTLEGHAGNVTATLFHPSLPLLFSGSEDGSLRVWSTTTYELLQAIELGLGRVWTLAIGRAGAELVAGFDHGTAFLKIGRDFPAISMDASGKIVMAGAQQEVQQALVAKLAFPAIDGEPLSLATKELGTSEIFPTAIKHSANGRFVTVIGGSEYVIYTALSFRNKAFGRGDDFAWSSDSSDYAVLNLRSVKVFRNFKESATLALPTPAKTLFGGPLLAVCSEDSVSFYSWAKLQLVRKIDFACCDCAWSPDGAHVSLLGRDNDGFILRFNAEVVAELEAAQTDPGDEGFPDAFEVQDTLPAGIESACWASGCLFLASATKLEYFAAGRTFGVSHLPRRMRLLGYVTATDRIYLADQEGAVVSYALPAAVLEYQAAVLGGDFEAADKILPSVPASHREPIAELLESLGHPEQALAIATDTDHRFELALSLGRFDLARDLARELDDATRWRQLGSAARQRCNFALAEECARACHDLDDLFLYLTCGGKHEQLGELARTARGEGQLNLAFVSLLLQGNVHGCIDLLITAQRHPEAAMFARSYAPSRISGIVKLWRDSLAKDFPRVAQSLADPEEYANLFPEYAAALAAEQQQDHGSESAAAVRTASPPPEAAPEPDAVSVPETPTPRASSSLDSAPPTPAVVVTKQELITQNISEALIESSAESSPPASGEDESDGEFLQVTADMASPQGGAAADSAAAPAGDDFNVSELDDFEFDSDELELDENFELNEEDLMDDDELLSD